MQERLQEILLKKNAGKIFKDKSRFKVVAAGRRFGKTRLVMIEIIEELLKGNTNVLYMAPTLDQARKIFWIPFLKIIPRAWIRHKTKSPMEITFVNGSVLTIASGESYERCRGLGLDLVVFDETADIPKCAFTEVIFPSLATTQGRCIFIGTPKGVNNWFYDMFQNENYTCFHFTTLDGGWVPKEEIEEAKKFLTLREFNQEYCASFESESSLVYDCYSKDNVKEMNFNPTKDIYLCWDFNYNPLCCILVQEQDDGTYGAIKEFVYRRTNTSEVCSVIFDYLEDNGVYNHSVIGPKIIITGDKSGDSHKTSATRTDYEIIKEWFQKFNGFKINVSRTPSIRDRVASLNQMFKNANGDIRMYINSNDCDELIKDFKKVEWNDTHRQLDGSDPDRTHASDALSYFAMNFFPSHRKKARTSVS